MSESNGEKASSRTDPDVPFSFIVEIGGVQYGQFREIQGLEWRADPVQFYEGGNYRHKVTLVGQGSFTPLTLKKGFFASTGEFYDWMNDVMDSGGEKVKRVTIGIIVRNEAREEIGRFDVYGAILTRYAGPSFNAMDSAIAVEEIEIAYDYFEYKPAGGKGA
ncbi:MAG TPA: phage tail protein [Myxococcota bacterium]|jgi:phage tail-like protein|nr:phage tail protein [Myxococcota bacterium]